MYLISITVSMFSLVGCTKVDIEEVEIKDCFYNELLNK